MATIVRHSETNERFVLLGSGFGAYQSEKPNWFFGNWMADLDEGLYAMVCVSNSEGNIGWLESSNVIVESIDGQSVTSIL